MINIFGRPSFLEKIQAYTTSVDGKIETDHIIHVKVFSINVAITFYLLGMDGSLYNCRLLFPVFSLLINRIIVRFHGRVDSSCRQFERKNSLRIQQILIHIILLLYRNNLIPILYLFIISYNNFFFIPSLPIQNKRSLLFIMSEQLIIRRMLFSVTPFLFYTGVNKKKRKVSIYSPHPRRKSLTDDNVDKHSVVASSLLNTGPLPDILALRQNKLSPPWFV